MLPGGEEEDAADGEVSQEHEEPDGRREGIKEGEVAWFTTLDTHTHTCRLHTDGSDVTVP